jgi:hypothetical protein
VLCASLLGFCISLEAQVKARIFDIDPPSDSPLFTYEMKKSQEGSVETWSAQFVDKEGKAVALENTTLQNGKLVRYGLEQPEFKESAEVKLLPTGVLFRFTRDGKTKEDFEKTTETVIVGPQLVDTLLANWESLMAGKSVSFRFAVPDRLQTIGFKLTKEKSNDPSKMVFHFSPTSFFIRQLVAPLVLTFESATKKMLSMKGRTFLKKKVGDGWVDLKAEFRFEP